LGYGKFNQQTYDSSKSSIQKSLTILNKTLEEREWIVGKRVTLADIITFSGLLKLFELVFTPEFLQPFPNVNAWAHRCMDQSQFKSEVPSFVWCKQEKLAEQK